MFLFDLSIYWYFHLVFQAVNQLCSHFEAYRDIPKIVELRDKFKNIKQILKSHVFSDFSRYILLLISILCSVCKSLWALQRELDIQCSFRLLINICFLYNVLWHVINLTRYSSCLVPKRLCVTGFLNFLFLSQLRYWKGDRRN